MIGIILLILLERVIKNYFTHCCVCGWVVFYRGTNRGLSFYNIRTVSLILLFFCMSWFYWIFYSLPLLLGCIFGGIPYIPVLSCSTQQNYVSLSHEKMEKEQKGVPKECASTSATADLHAYLLRRSAIKFSFLLKNNNHASTSPNEIRFLFV